MYLKPKKTKTKKHLKFNLWACFFIFPNYYTMEHINNALALNLPLKYVILFLAGYIIGTYITYKIVKGTREHHKHTN